ncbi:hypothetical protein PR048_011681 [Dryococelus australis]|uniref:Uncharacterized protein n=1 Tax=Dryococelus australis TaxID=614101 RepID=A0ABQ9HMA4_9NEOP|nr:hypothetical protein PR048_011681 [Dryococelus australis]
MSQWTILLYEESAMIAAIEDVKAGFSINKAAEKNGQVSGGKDTTLKKKDFAKLLDTAINNSFCPEQLQNAFHKCGIYPWDPLATDASKIIARCNRSKISAHFLQFITAGDLWNGDVKDTSLFEFWKHIKSLVTTQPDIGVNSATPPSGYYPHIQLMTHLDVSPATSDAVPLASVDIPSKAWQEYYSHKETIKREEEQKKEETKIESDKKVEKGKLKARSQAKFDQDDTTSSEEDDPVPLESSNEWSEPCEEENTTAFEDTP